MPPFAYRQFDGDDNSDSQYCQLPPIREWIPEINEPLRYNDARSLSQASSERGSFSYALSSSDESHIPRTQHEAEDKSLFSHVPRTYHGPRQLFPPSPQLSPSSREFEGWNTPVPTSPVTARGIPAPVEMQIQSPGPRIALPRITIPSVTRRDIHPPRPRDFENEVTSRPRQFSRARSHDYAMYLAQNRHSLPPSPQPRFERSPFSSSVFSTPQYQDAAHFENMGSAAARAESRPRRRRGNLPKETTEKLRNWFYSHLAHPYPTEDEKQDLMRRTGLQMNQISNWFINARRRILPLIKKKIADALDLLNSGQPISKEAEALLKLGQALFSHETNSAASPAASDGTTVSEETVEALRQQLESLERDII
ncbi:hypothetical protein ACQKWADRAFT_51897 [Trichoderma austrokoningii]